MSSRQLTTTSYAILGLLAVKPWATYDLAKQLQRSLHFFWPRAESNLYAEPKRLVEAGLHIPTDVHDPEIGAGEEQLRAASERAGPDRGTRGEHLEGPVLGGDEGVGQVLARGDGS